MTSPQAEVNFSIENSLHASVYILLSLDALKFEVVHLLESEESFKIIRKLYWFNKKNVSSRGAGSQACGCNATVVASILTRGNVLLFINITFLRSGVNAKRGVEFRHLKRNASKIRRKVKNGVS